MTQKEVLYAWEELSRFIKYGKTDNLHPDAALNLVRQYIEGQRMPNVAEIANVVLKAAGTDIRHYMPRTQIEIIDALQQYFLPQSGEE